jgi:hypothetical protein
LHSGRYSSAAYGYPKDFARSLGRKKIDLFRFPNKQTGGAEIPSTKHTNPSDLVSQLEMILARPPKAQNMYFLFLTAQIERPDDDCTLRIVTQKTGAAAKNNEKILGLCTPWSWN